MRTLLLFFLLCCSCTLSAQAVYLSDSNLHKGYRQMYAGYYEDAVYFFSEGLQKALREGNEPVVAEAYRLLGEVNRGLHNKEEALKYFELAEAGFTRLKIPYGLASVYNRKAATYFEMGLKDSFSVYVSKSMLIAEKNGYNTIIYNNLVLNAAIKIQQGDFADASAQLTKAWELVTDLGVEEDYPFVLQNFVDLWQKKGNTDSALFFGRLGYDYAKRIGVKTSIRTASSRLSDLFEKKGMHDSALVYQKIYAHISYSLFLEGEKSRLLQVANRYENERQAEIIERQKILITLSVACGFALVVLSVFLYRAYRRNKRSKLKLIEAKIQLEQAGRELHKSNVLKDKLLSVLSHDLRSPLASISMLIEMINENEMNSQEIKEVLRELNLRTGRTSDLLNNLLLWIKGQIQIPEPKIEAVAIRETVKENLLLLMPYFQEKSLVIEEEFEDNVSVNTDREMLKFILRNLLNNAIKYSKKGGSVVIGGKKEGVYYKLWIKDHGIGMEQARKESLFNVMAYSDKGTSDEVGMGIGLNIVKNFTQIINARIEVESEPGNGSVFSLYLPLN